MFVSQPWKYYNSIVPVIGKSITKSPWAIWFMYFMTYVLFMFTEIGIYAILVALLFSFILTRVDFQKQFYTIKSKMEALNNNDTDISSNTSRDK